MSNLHWMPLYIGDYLADTSHLTIEQSGCYLHLLMSQWRVGYVPDDDTKLAALCRVTRTHFARHIAPAIRPFFTSDGERLIQVRLEKERKKSAKISEKQAENARKMHVKRADINDLAPAKAHASTTTTTVRGPFATLTPSNQADFVAFWGVYPRKVGKGQAERAWRAALKRAQPEQILSAVRDYPFKRGEPEFIPHPATWLNGQRWLDEVPGTTTASASTPRAWNDDDWLRFAVGDGSRQASLIRATLAHQPGALAKYEQMLDQVETVQ